MKPRSWVLLAIFKRFMNKFHCQVVQLLLSLENHVLRNSWRNWGHPESYLQILEGSLSPGGGINLTQYCSRDGKLSPQIREGHCDHIVHKWDRQPPHNEEESFVLFCLSLARGSFRGCMITSCRLLLCERSRSIMSLLTPKFYFFHLKYWIRSLV